MKVVHRADTRGNADHGWLKSRHTFSFADYYEPNRMSFGALRVINDDWVQGGAGFPTHGHRDMEIITIPLKGRLAHQDSTGQERELRTGEVQIMSAGQGIRHSEFNGSRTEPVQFLQIWVTPKAMGLRPRYAQKFFDPAECDGRWQMLVSPSEMEGSLWINQEAYFSRSRLHAGQELRYEREHTGNGLYLFVIEGRVNVADETLGQRDAIGLTEIGELRVEALEDITELLLIEVPMALKDA